MKLNASPITAVSFAMVVGVMGTALISPLYALYQQAWQLQASDIALVYVIYMAGALCALLLAGRLPDRMGFRPVMQWGLVLVVVGTVISLAAWNMASLSVGRFLVGAASSLVMTSATTGLSRMSRPEGMQRMATMSSFLLAFGFGVGPLIGGVMGQWAAAPLVTAYLPTLALSIVGLVVVSRLPLPTEALPVGAVPLHWRDVLPRLTWPASPVGRTFALTGCLPFLAFGVFGLYASMAPLFLDDLVPWHGPVVSGTTIALILFSSAVIQVVARRLPTHWCGTLGLLGLAASNAVLMADLRTGSVALFVLGVLLTAMGHGMSMLAGMTLVNRLATPRNRSGLLSTYMVMGYVGSMVPMMGVGWIADHWGMERGVFIFCTAVITIGLAAAVQFQRDPHMLPAGVRA